MTHLVRARRFLAAWLLALPLLAACGGGQGEPAANPSEPAPTPADDPAEDATPPDETPEDEAHAADEKTDEAPAAKKGDGIIRDADGDGKPDSEDRGCDGKSKKQCQILMSCAWSDQGKCVKSSDL